MDMVWFGLEALRRWWASAGTYLLVEMVLPGGTLLALLLYLYRRRRYARERYLMRVVSNPPMAERPIPGLVQDDLVTG